MIVKYPNIFTEDPTLKLGFDKINSDDTSNVEFHIAPRMDFDRKEGIKYYCLDLELPNGFVNKPGREDSVNIYEKKYDKIFTICPYTVKIRNRVLDKELYHYCYFPSSDSWNTENEKEIDVIYTGSGAELVLNDDISKFNYRVLNKFPTKYLTHSNLSFLQKLEMISKSKITITHNIINLSNSNLNFDVKNFFEIGTSKLGFPIITQHKSRVIEAARCKSLILCKEDDFNIIEDLFTPNEDFIYYNNNNLGETIKKVLENYIDYLPIIENAFNKVNKKYDIINFYNNFIK